MTFLDKLKEINMFESEETIENAVYYFYQHRIYISDLEDEPSVPEKLKEFAFNFLETDSEYDGDEAEAWKRLLSQEVPNE